MIVTQQICIKKVQIGKLINCPKELLKVIYRYISNSQFFKDYTAPFSKLVIMSVFQYSLHSLVVKINFKVMLSLFIHYKVLQPITSNIKVLDDTASHAKHVLSKNTIEELNFQF